MTSATPAFSPLWAQMMQVPGGEPESPPPLPFPEIAAPPVVEVSLPIVWLVIGSLLLLLALWLLLKPFWTRVSAAVQSQGRPLSAALRALRELRGRAAGLTPAEIGHEVSETLRHYYYHRYGVPAPFRTTEELFPPVQDTQESSRRKHWREKFEPLAAFYDVLAYAPHTVTEASALRLIDDAIARLESEVGSAEHEAVNLPPAREVSR